MNCSSIAMPAQNIYTFLFTTTNMFIKIVGVYFLMYVYSFTKLARYESAFDPSKSPYGVYAFQSESDTSDSDEYETDDYETDDENEGSPNPTRKPEFTVSNFSEKFADEYKKATIKILTPEELRRLSCNFVVEQTPLGNVFMCYHYNENDPELNAFHYYSDSTIPYGFLQVVAKKYVVTFDCKMVYVDIQSEVDASRKKQEEPNQSTTSSTATTCEELTATHPPATAIQPPPPSKPSVFAKFKEYNRDTMSQSKELLQPKLSSQQSNSQMNAKLPPTTNKENKTVVKEKINKYVFKGRVQNFEFLKKVDRKLVDKKYGITFSDFKLLYLTKTPTHEE